MSDPKEDLEEKQKNRKMTQRQREIYNQKLKEIRDNPDPSVLGEDGRIDLAKAIEKAQQLAQDIEFRELNRAKNANTFESVLLKEKNAIRKDTDHSMKDYLGESLGKKDNSFFNTELNKYANKFAIDKVAQEYKGKTKNADIQKLLENVSKYTEIVDSNADAVKGIRGEDRIDPEVKRSLKREAMIQNKITRDAEKLFEKLQKDLSDAMEKVTPVEIDGKVIYEDANIKQLSDELRMVTGIFEYFDALKTGSLEVPEDQVIDYSFTAVKRTGAKASTPEIPADASKKSFCLSGRVCGAWSDATQSSVPSLSPSHTFS